MSSISHQAQQLIDALHGYGSCAVAFSAGVDSTVVAMAAHLALGDLAVAVIGIGPALPSRELESARSLARQIGLQLIETPTEEINQSDYVRNDFDRCFHCKNDLYSHVRRVMNDLDLAEIANGANAEDRTDHRPGMRAADDWNVRSPLADCGFGKAEVRRLAAYWNLPVADKPASPCLASRIAYGQEVTPERLHMIDQAEELLRDLGVRELRVRYHQGDLARVEASAECLARLAEESTRRQIVQRFSEIGFKYVTLDLTGFRSGSMNEVIPVDALQQWANDPASPPAAKREKQ